MFTFKEIDTLLNHHSYQWENKQNCNFDKASNINQAVPNSICWIKNGNGAIETLLNTLENCCVVLPYGVTVQNLETSCNSFIFCEDPKYIYALIVNEFFVEKLIPTIHPTAIIHPEAHLGRNVYIGPYVEIGRCEIGNNVTIHSHTKLHDKTQIGDNVTINSCVVIGGDGFGYSSNKQGVESIKFPHLGGVIIENGVEIGSNTCIDKGALGNTVIRKNVKIDNLVHIAHNVVIDENTFVIAHTIIGGSTTIGKNSWIAPNTSILNGLVIGDSVTVGMGSVVTKNIPNNEVWAGNPAKPTQEIKAYNQKINQILNQL